MGSRLHALVTRKVELTFIAPVLYEQLYVVSKFQFRPPEDRFKHPNGLYYRLPTVKWSPGNVHILTGATNLSSLIMRKLC